MSCSPAHADWPLDEVMSDGMEGMDEEVGKEESDILIYMFIAPR